MSTGLIEGQALANRRGRRDLIINDFSIVVATANGTGSQTSNLAILRALFKMGIPSTARISSRPTFRACRPGITSAPAVTVIPPPAHVGDSGSFQSGHGHPGYSSTAAGGICIYNGDWRSIPSATTSPTAVPVNEFVRGQSQRKSCGITSPTWYTSARWPICWRFRWRSLMRR